ncbi:hypothetical protein AB0284_21405 [Pseudarthrobacter phenanthrenivorans]|uniref:hypothetical protein n=1 Tax=Pseudarthrobacter phenanthrenivorans TaxID=361575 RepID=UPI00344D9AEB
MPTLTGKADVGRDGGEFVDVQTIAPVTDWTDIFRRFNLDPEAFEIVGDTVRCSTWQTSKRTDNGDRDVQNLYSYRASFRRKTVNGLDLGQLIGGIRDWKPAQKSNNKSDRPAALVVSMADWQLGKGEGDGTKGTIRRLEESLASIVEYADKLKGVDHLVLANMGDHTENVAGSYASQTHTVDLNMRDQLTLAIETNLAWIKALAPMFQRVTYAAALCNHGQLSRGNGRDNVTDDADNATGLIGDTLRTICNSHDALKRIEWNVPRDEMITRVRAAGVNMPLSHGHKISGKEEDWLAKQSQYLTQVHRYIPDVWHTAHKHHAALTDYGPYTRIQATTVDPGSKWLLDAAGMYSRPGTTTFLIGAHLPGKWAEYRIH